MILPIPAALRRGLSGVGGPAAALLFSAPLVSAQTEILVATGDVIPGLGTVADVYEVVVNDAGQWAASVRAVGDSHSQVALIRNGVLFLRPGDPLPNSFTGTYQAARGLILDAQGGLVWQDGAPTAAAGPSFGVFRDLEPLTPRGQPANVPGAPAGATYHDSSAAVVVADGRVWVTCRLQTGPSFQDRDAALVRFDPQPGGGYAPSLELYEGAILPGTSLPLMGFESRDRSLAANSSGELLFAAGDTGFTQPDVDGIFSKTDAIALEDTQAPVFGAQWGSLNECALALNDAGDYAILATLDDNRRLVTWNGLPVAIEGDSVPSIAPFAITELDPPSSRAPVLRLSAAGRVLWYGEWSDPDGSRDSGLFLDQELILQEGVGGIGGVALGAFDVVDSLPFRAHFDLSPDGSQIVVRNLLADGRSAAVRFVRGGSATSIPGCVGNPGLLSLANLSPSAQEAPVGEGLLMRMEQEQSPAAAGVVLISSAQLSPCGVVLPGIGEVLIDTSPAGLLWVGAGLDLGPFTLVVGPVVPDDPHLAGVELFAQGLWLDAGFAAEPVRLTNGLAFELGVTWSL